MTEGSPLLPLRPSPRPVGAAARPRPSFSSPNTLQNGPAVPNRAVPSSFVVWLQTCSDTEDDGAECLKVNSEICQPSYVPFRMTRKHKFVSADDNVQAVADLTDAEEVDPTSGPAPFLHPYCSQACTTAQICHCCGIVDNAAFLTWGRY